MINSKQITSYLIEMSETIKLYEKKWPYTRLKTLSTKCV